jgi:coenzyme F420-reducing hydrogenase alpha subunit
MSVEGQLQIQLQLAQGVIQCQLSSSRPIQASKLFAGKSINHVLRTLPMLFSICGKAQAVTAVRAIENATEKPASDAVESTREALIALESLREHALRVAMDWPVYIKEKPDNQVLARISLGINQLMQALEPQHALAYQADAIKFLANSKQQWESCSTSLAEFLFADSAQNWMQLTIPDWVERQHTQASRFIYWLGQKSWKDAGQSGISSLPSMNNKHDKALKERLLKDGHRFTAMPTWDAQCYELGWFNQWNGNSNKITNNGIYSRMLARLFEIAELIQKLDDFFIRDNKLPIAYQSEGDVKGIAHTNAARGRLTHCVDIEGSVVRQLLILAPTEWNFHPQGVAVDSLRHLQGNSPQELRQQAELLIHAIDPCVGYALNIEITNNKR